MVGRHAMPRTVATTANPLLLSPSLQLPQLSVAALPSLLHAARQRTVTDGRRSCHSTPGTHLRQPDAATGPYTQMSLGSTSSGASMSHLHLQTGDLSLGLSGTHNLMPGKSQSQATSQSHSSEDDTITGRAGAGGGEDKTHGSLRGAAAASSSSAGGGGGNGNNTGTVTLPSGGHGGMLNLSAGAAAIAALTGSGAAGSAGGGNNTGNMSMGLRRFGLKSKAVRVTPAGAADRTGPADPSAAAPGPAAEQPAQHAPAAPFTAAGAAGAVLAARTEPGAEMHAAAASSPMDVDTYPEAAGAGAADDLHRKRKPEVDARCRSPPAQLQPAEADAPVEGPKRRQSPEGGGVFRPHVQAAAVEAPGTSSTASGPWPAQPTAAHQQEPYGGGREVPSALAPSSSYAAQGGAGGPAAQPATSAHSQQQLPGFAAHPPSTSHPARPYLDPENVPPPGTMHAGPGAPPALPARPERSQQVYVPMDENQAPVQQPDVARKEGRPRELTAPGSAAHDAGREPLR